MNAGRGRWSIPLTGTSRTRSARRRSRGAQPPTHLGVQRTALLQRCDEATGAQLVLLEAPAGFGKTYTLAQWCERESRRHHCVAWLGLRSTERTAESLAHRLLAGLREAGVTNLPSSKLSCRGGAAAALNQFVARFKAEIGSLRRRVILVLDDYQRIAGSSGEELLAAIFEQPPSNVVFALASRHTCRIAPAQLLLQGRLLRLQGRTLLFSRAETQALFGRSISPTQLKAVHALTGGWPAALEMIRLCRLDQQTNLERLHVSAQFTRLIDDYCQTEILRDCGAEASEFLSECSILETLKSESCDAIRERHDSGEILASLAERETFLEPANAEVNTWCLPLLLRQVLLRRAARRGSPVIAAANLRAARHFESCDQTAQAIRHYIAAGDPTAAAVALERINPLLIALIQGDLRAIELLSAIPDTQVQLFPRLALCRAHLDYKRGLLSEARSLLSDLGRRTQEFSRDRSGGDHAQLKTEAITVELVMDFYTRSHAPLDQVREIERQLLKVSEVDPRFAIMFHLILGVRHTMRGELATAETHFIHCEKLNVRERSPWTRVWLRYHLGLIALARGQLAESRYQLQAGLKLWRADFRNYATYEAWAKLVLAEIDYETDSLAEAQAKVDAALYTAEQIEGWFEPYAAAYEVAMMLHWHGGRLDQMDALLAHGSAPQHISTMLHGFRRTLRIRFELLRGQHGAAQAIAEQDGLYDKWTAATFQDDFSYREWDLLGLCLSHLALRRGALEIAENIALRLEQTARLAGRMRTVTRARIVRALIARAWGDEQSAIERLVQALELGQGHGYRRAFLDEGESLIALLALVSARGSDSVPPHLISYAAMLHNLLRKKDRRAGTESSSLLSEREHDVVRELSLGTSNKLIARKLGVSDQTVKFHVGNLFRKLGVRKRAAAVAEAHRRGWLR